MKISIHENLGLNERLSRILVGVSFAMLPLFITDPVMIIASACASVYPLLTGLLAIEPVYLVIESTIWKPVANRKSLQSLAA